MAVVPLCIHPRRIYLVILILFSTLHCPSLSADLLEVRLFSETLSKLAADGLGVSALQVTNKLKNKIQVKIESPHQTDERVSISSFEFVTECFFFFFFTSVFIVMSTLTHNLL